MEEMSSEVVVQVNYTIDQTFKYSLQVLDDSTGTALFI
jgi:hypothetical protein